MKGGLWRVLVGLTWILCSGCGGGEDEGFPELIGDWVVEGLRCEEATMSGLIQIRHENEGPMARYARDTSCVSEGDPFWDVAPRGEDEEVLLRVVSDLPLAASVTVRDADSLRFDAVDGSTLLLRRVSPEVNPPAHEPRGFDLGGIWWMEGYPCPDEGSPQLVFALHSGSLLSLRKVIGDQCIGSGVGFFDGSVVDALIEGEAELIEWDPFTWEGDEFPQPVSATGQVRTEEYFTLNVLGQVRFRRVLSESL
jgi:hypothetical protein